MLWPKFLISILSGPLEDTKTRAESLMHDFVGETQIAEQLLAKPQGKHKALCKRIIRVT